MAWGPGFALAGWIASEGLFYWDIRNIGVLALVTLWAARLAVHLYQRHAGEDRRYAQMRENFAPQVWVWRSLFQVFLLQAILIWLISWPLQFAITSPRPFHVWDVMGFGLAIAGFSIEALSDWQLSRFRADPANRSRVMDRGLWHWSRHPNYFGDCLMWWGIFLIALTAGAPGWMIVSPLTMTLLLVKISGIPLLEADIIDRRPGYAKYIRETRAFFPWPPKKS
jgi:steroid 5-alpha reductase family enzyme